MLCHVAIVRTDVSEERSASFIRVHLVFLRSVHRLLVTATVVRTSPIHVTVIKEALYPSETLVLTRTTRRNISEDAILQYIKMLLSLTKLYYNSDSALLPFIIRAAISIPCSVLIFYLKYSRAIPEQTVEVSTSFPSDVRTSSAYIKVNLSP
jgi:hypothetical protein